MDGLAVLRAIKTYDPQIEVLIITGYGTIKNAIELVRLGACGYLTKPFHISEVTNEIIQAIEKKRRIDRNSSDNVSVRLCPLLLPFLIDSSLKEFLSRQKPRSDSPWIFDEPKMNLRGFAVVLF